MPGLKWNEYDFVECLGVLPEIDDYETGHHFTVKKENLTLVISIWQYDCLFEFSLFQNDFEKPFMNFYLSVREEVKFVNHKQSSYLIFRDCAIVSPKHPITDSVEFVKHIDSDNLAMELEVEPQIQIKFV